MCMDFYAVSGFMEQVQDMKAKMRRVQKVRPGSLTDAAIIRSISFFGKKRVRDNGKASFGKTPSYSLSSVGFS